MERVRVEQVWKIYGKDFEAVRSASFSMHDGEFVSLLGPSGCGKTSTLRMIAGLEEISRGDVYIDDIRVNDLDPGDRNVAMAFEAYALYPHLTVFENIAYPLRIRRVAEEEIKTRVSELIDSLGISQYADSYPRALSGGAQQRTGLGRALVRPASVYLLDEVLSHLDATERTMLRAEIRRIQKLMGLTSLFVTHDQLEALAMSDRIIVMNDAEIQQIGTPEEIYDTPANLFVAGFVGEPPMNILNVERRRTNGTDTLAFGGTSASAADLGLRWIPDTDTFYMGIRPKYVNLASPDAPGNVKGTVHTFEVLGDVTLSSIELEDGLQVFMLAGRETRLELDERVAFNLNAERVVFYNSDTGEIIARD